MRRFSYALVTGLSLSLLPAVVQAAPANPSSPAPKAAHSAQTRAQQSPAEPKMAKSTLAAKDDKTRYAEREAASPEAQNYRGGDTVVIGATTATAILAIILLIVLI
jgi:hypothetical protein